MSMMSWGYSSVDSLQFATFLYQQFCQFAQGNKWLTSISSDSITFYSLQILVCQIAILKTILKKDHVTYVSIFFVDNSSRTTVVYAIYNQVSQHFPTNTISKKRYGVFVLLSLFIFLVYHTQRYIDNFSLFIRSLEAVPKA